MTLKNLLRRVGAALGLSLLAGGMAAEAKAPLTPPVAHPALWEVSDADTTIYLFGTIHLLPTNTRWRTDKFNAAVAASQQLVVETIVDQKNPQKLIAAMASLGFANGLKPLALRVHASKRPALAAAIKKSGYPPQALDRMKTWAAAITLLGTKFKEIGLEGGEGPETVLREAFAASGKPTGELESNVEQLAFFDRLPEASQLMLLEGSIEEGKAMNNEFGGMLKAWSRGDVQGIARTFDRDLAGSPEVQRTLIQQRNANWSKWIEQRMGQPGAILVAVGAGHLAGKDSVLQMLRKDGYTVRRLQ